MEIVWSSMALCRLREIREFIAQDKPGAAERLGIRITALVEVLRRQPNLGRAGSVSGTRELIVGGTPYIVVYRPSRTRVTILTIWHAAQERKR